MSVQERAKLPEITGKELTVLTDEELMILFQQGTVPAYDLLVRRYKDQLMNYVYHFVGDTDEAEDVLQDTFVRVYRNKNSYKPIAKFATWLFTIAGNQARTVLRRRRAHFFISIFQRENEEDTYLPLADKNPLPDRLTDRNILSKRIRASLLRIPAPFREAVILRDIEEMEYEEIAAIIHLPVGTVKSRINRGRTLLRALLHDIHD